MTKKQRKAPGVRRETQKSKKKRQRLQFIKTHKLLIAAGILGALAIVIGLALAIDYFYTPAGGMKVFLGQVVGAEENHIIANLNEGGAPAYYDLGSYQAPEGYIRSGSLNETEDPRVQRFQYRAEDESSLIQIINVQGAAGLSAEERTEYLHLQALRLYGVSSGPLEGEINGRKVHYLYTVSPNPILDEATNQYPDENRASLSLIFDTKEAGIIHVELSSRILPRNQVPTADVLFAMAPDYVAGLEIAE